MTTEPDVMTMLEATSRTFFIPISRMPPSLREATTSAYLCMRAIDEIEDHPALPAGDKARLLRRVSLAIQSFSYDDGADLGAALDAVFEPHRCTLAEVSLRLAEWAGHAPPEIAPRILGDTAAMADRMAEWAAANWRIRSQADLDGYTYSVAAAVGLLMCDVAAWYDGTHLSRRHAIHFGRGLQVTNIARNRADDLARGVDFYPPGWDDQAVRDYAGRWLASTAAYAGTLPDAPVSYFIRIPLALAQATLAALDRGEVKLTRDAVHTIVDGWE